MRFLRYLYFILLVFISSSFKAQNEHSPYYQYWVTDIPIWYNCGGFHALINYNFKGNGHIKIEDEYGQKFEYGIKDGRLIKYHYSNMKNTPMGVIEKHGISAYFRATASFGYEEKAITHHLIIERGTGVLYDINFDYQIINNDSILKNITRYRYKYKDYKLMKTGTLLRKNDSTIIDTIPIVSPYYIRGSRIKKLSYEVNPTQINIYANDNSLNSSLIVEYNLKGDITILNNNGITYFFENHKYDHYGNWTEVDVFDSNHSFIKKYHRKIKYFENK